MKKLLDTILRRELPLVDFVAQPFVFSAAVFFRKMRRMGLERFKHSKKILYKVGVYPLIEHYYEPLFKFKKLRYDFDKDRNLPGIDFNDKVQLKLLSQFHYNEELLRFPIAKASGHAFYYDNMSFMSGDAEYLYNMIRFFKPHKMIEIGSGHSTMIAREALRMNKAEDAQYDCEHICVEPYEQKWLESTGVKVIRERVENLDISLFLSLRPNDILFIDSSHMIRPQGDVLFEYQEIMPCLACGVIVHLHDIFSPREYPEEWLRTGHFWNEQYLLETMLSYASSFEILGALNYLSHHYRKEFEDKCPVFKIQTDREPGSFWMQKK